jgi:hypothetical protein
MSESTNRKHGSEAEIRPAQNDRKRPEWQELLSSKWRAQVVRLALFRYLDSTAHKEKSPCIGLVQTAQIFLARVRRGTLLAMAAGCLWRDGTYE